MDYEEDIEKNQGFLGRILNYIWEKSMAGKKTR